MALVDGVKVSLGRALVVLVNKLVSIIIVKNQHSSKNGKVDRC